MYWHFYCIDIFTDDAKATVGEISDAFAWTKAMVQNYTTSHCNYSLPSTHKKKSQVHLRILVLGLNVLNINPLVHVCLFLGTEMRSTHKAFLLHTRVNQCFPNIQCKMFQSFQIMHG